MTNNVAFERYAKEYPHDGQDGLGALIDALSAGAITLVIAFIVLFLLQQAFINRRE